MRGQKEKRGRSLLIEYKKKENEKTFSLLLGKHLVHFGGIRLLGAILD